MTIAYKSTIRHLRYGHVTTHTVFGVLSTYNIECALRFLVLIYFHVFFLPGLLKGNCDRLIIALTKIDTFLSTDDDGSDDDDNVATLEEVQAGICKLIKDGTKGHKELSPSSIYPVSGKWALTSSKLSNSLVALEKNELVSQTEYQNRY